MSSTSPIRYSLMLPSKQVPVLILLTPDVRFIAGSEAILDKGNYVVNFT